MANITANDNQEGMDLVAKAFHIDVEVAMTVTRRGVIHLFSDSRHSTMQVDSHGSSRNTRKSAMGNPIEGGLVSEIEKALADPKTIGIAATTEKVYGYLRGTGKVNKGIYQRNDRVYYLF